MTSFTKEVVNNYFLQFTALIIRWAMFHGEPVIASFQLQVVFYFLIKKHMVTLDMSGPGSVKAFSRTEALLSKPEGTFQTDEDG